MDPQNQWQLELDSSGSTLLHYILRNIVLGYSSSFMSSCGLFLLLRMQDLGRRDRICLSWSSVQTTWNGKTAAAPLPKSLISCCTVRSDLWWVSFLNIENNPKTINTHGLQWVANGNVQIHFLPILFLVWDPRYYFKTQSRNFKAQRIYSV